MKKFLKENILNIVSLLLLFACGLTTPIYLLVACIIGGEIISGILLSLIFGLPILTLLGFTIWSFIQDYKIEKTMEKQI